MVAIHSLEPDSEPIRRRSPAFLQAAEEVDFQELLRTLWRRKSVVFGTMAVLTTLAAVIVYQLTPSYTAEAYVMIDTRKTQVVDVEAVISGLPVDRETVQSEILVMGSRGLSEKVIRRLELGKDPEFNEELKPESPFAKLFDPRKYVPEEWLAVFSGLKAQDEELTKEERRDRTRVRITDKFLEGLEVTPVRRSRVIRVAFESESPRMAARAANTLSELYIVSQLEAKFEATRQATKWLNERLSELRGQLEGSEAAVEAFRKKTGLVEGKGVTIASQQIAELNTQLVLAGGTRAEAEARLKQIESLRSAGSGMETLAEVLDSQLVQRLREQEAVVVRKAAELSARYGERHPRMINVRAEIRDLEEKIGREVERIAQGLANELEVARAREISLQAGLETLKHEVATANESEIELRALEREAAVNRALFETFLGRSKETRAQEDNQRPDARIISRADVPEEPSYPRKGIVLLVALVASVLAGVVLVFVGERFDQGFRSMEQIEQLTGVTPFGLVPALKGVATIGKSPESYILKKPASAYGEALRSLHTSLLLSNVDRPPKVVLFASSLPKEGKTAVTLSLARMLANIGQKVVVVDCDLRRPRAHRVFGVASRPGLVEFLAGKALLEEVIHHDRQSAADLVPAGSSASNPTELLGSERMAQFLSGLAETYDLVLIDSSPVLAVSEVRILSRHVDKVVFLVRWAGTRREVAVAGLKQFLDAGSDVAGVLLSMVDVKKHARYGYGDSGYYYGAVRKYYTG